MQYTGRTAIVNVPGTYTRDRMFLIKIVLIVMSLMTINLSLCWYAQINGHYWALFSFFARINDAFADYFKSIASLPGAEQIDPSHFLGLKDRILYAKTSWYQPGFTNMHSPPAVMLFFLVNLKLMIAADPAACFLILNTALFLYFCYLSKRYTNSTGEAISWVVLVIVSYPTVLMVIRGNVMAGLTAALLIHTMLLSIRGRSPIVAGALLAIAVNFRPNAIAFALPLLLLQHREWLKASGSLAVVGLILFVASLFAAHGLYPQYDFDTFRHGLTVYYQKYVIENYGLENGSSLYGALKMLFEGGHYRPGLDLLAAIPAAIIGLSGGVAYLYRRVSAVTLIFLTAAAYTLGSTVIADYHLMVFLVVPLVIAGTVDTQPLAAADRMSLLGACLMLVPKHYLYIEGISLQLVFNPLILLVTSVVILCYAIVHPKLHGDKPLRAST